MNREQLVNLVIIPTLKQIPYGISGVLAISMIIAHESKRGEFLKQIGGGPALGLIQMEPLTHDSTWKYGDSVWVNAKKLGIISSFDHSNKIRPLSDRLIYDLRYNVFMARQRLFMKDGALPDNIDDLSRYLKKHWNSVAGAASEMSYRDDYLKWG